MKLLIIKNLKIHCLKLIKNFDENISFYHSDSEIAEVFLKKNKYFFKPIISTYLIINIVFCSNH